ncbi:hypothetical protein evm_005177 [Chilo suppressalis]|nr:hypothetical protein evm_005177 [Chilo suppressalis]
MSYCGAHTTGSKVMMIKSNYIEVPGDDSTQPDSSDCEHEKPVQLKKDLDPKFSKSTHGNPIILLDGYKFRLKRDSRVVKSLNVRWVCSTMKHGCKAKLMTVENVVVSYDNVHNHQRPKDRSSKKDKSNKEYSDESD